MHTTSVLRSHFALIEPKWPLMLPIWMLIVLIFRLPIRGIVLIKLKVLLIVLFPKPKRSRGLLKRPKIVISILNGAFKHRMFIKTFRNIAKEAKKVAKDA